MQPQSSTGASAYAANLAAGFEQSLQSFIMSLPSHRTLIAYAVGQGHRTRPIGCLLSCSAVGGDWSKALDVAIGIELLHKSSVVRDDIADRDEMRSGQPALHVAYGTSRAIAVSDVLLTLGLGRIADGVPALVADQCLRSASDALREMAAGQLEDVCPSPNRRGIEDRLLVDERKTGSLAGLACQLGAIVGGGTAIEITKLTQYGRKLGTAFQVLNDVRNLTGEEEARVTASDLRNGRRTVISAHADRRLASQSPALSAVTNESTDAEAEATRKSLLATGAAEFGEALCSRILREARTELEALNPNPATTILDSLTRGLLREHAF